MQYDGPQFPGPQDKGVNFQKNWVGECGTLPEPG